MMSSNDDPSSLSFKGKEPIGLGYANVNQSFRNLQELLSERNPLKSNTIDPPARRGRARSTTLQSRENPAETPLNADEHRLARLVRDINKKNAAEQAAKAQSCGVDAVACSNRK
jgi:hypothetical protein